MSKQLKSKKSRGVTPDGVPMKPPAALTIPAPQEDGEKSVTDGSSVHVHGLAVPVNVPQGDASSVKAEPSSIAVTPGPALSCRTTDSGDSPLDLCDLSMNAPEQKGGVCLMFDADVYAALAQAELEDELRSEAEFTAIVRGLMDESVVAAA